MPSKLKTFARSAKQFARRVLRPRAHMEATFAPFYTENRWGDDESVSGPGSSLTRTAKLRRELPEDRKSTRLNSSHGYISYAVFCLKKKKKKEIKLITDMHYIEFM